MRGRILTLLQIAILTSVVWSQKVAQDDRIPPHAEHEQYIKRNQPTKKAKKDNSS